MHGVWGEVDHTVLSQLQPDLVLFVGDLGEGDVRIAQEIKDLPYPSAVILGNHDRGNDSKENVLKHQLRTLGNSHCSWKEFNCHDLDVSVVGGRPLSAGGGFHLSQGFINVYGCLTAEESAQRIVESTKQLNNELPLILLSHSGPRGLGSDADSICGRDWKNPAIDWGDTDLTLAINQIKGFRHIDLVVFGHMHHQLKRGCGLRQTFISDSSGTHYLNAACVPRRVKDINGQILTHFSLVEFTNGTLVYAAHIWYSINGYPAYRETLLDLREAC